jgi:AraC family transcriptional regulator
MNCAKVLLTEKKKSVTETAYIMGYENVSHFSSTFKKFFGLLPGVLLKEGVVTEE